MNTLTARVAGRAPARPSAPAFSVAEGERCWRAHEARATPLDGWIVGPGLQARVAVLPPDRRTSHFADPTGERAADFGQSSRDLTRCGVDQPGRMGPTGPRGSSRVGEDVVRANAALIREDGWMLLSDEVRLDEEGCLCVIGRRVDLIIRGGRIARARLRDDIRTRLLREAEGGEAGTER